jgi:polyisoprenoid-binding protein YceI
MTEWKLDPAHSSISFAIRHMMVTTVHGRFTDFDARLQFDPDRPEDAKVKATIRTESIDTGVEDRDNHLRSADFFDVEKNPVITFESTDVDIQGDKEAEVTGNLAIGNVSRPVTIKASYLGQQVNPFTGTPTLGFEGQVKINREDFGLTWNQALETGGVLVGKDVRITLDLQAVPAEEAAAV